MICTGRQIKADEALRIGLVNHVVTASNPRDKGLGFAILTARGAFPAAMRASAHLLQRGQDLDLANANGMEADVFGLLFASENRREGIQAFLAQRPPKFASR